MAEVMMLMLAVRVSNRRALLKAAAGACQERGLPAVKDWREAVWLLAAPPEIAGCEALIGRPEEE